MKRGFFFLLAITVITPLLANDKTLPNEEKLLRYQEVFHHFYRKDELNALINLNSGFATNTISPQIQSNQLLQGALYNSYGLPNVGVPQLRNVATSASRENVKDLAWFYLAKQFFEEENFTMLDAAMTKVGETLPSAEKNQLQYMRGMHLIQTRDLKKAEKVLETLDLTSNRYQFLLFNLGAAYLKTNKADQGIKYLAQVGSLQQQDETLLSLKDKANIVLGYHYLRADQSAVAAEYFQKVRLEGAFSEKALLGLGWAYSQMEQHRRALVPWLLLTEKDSSHIEVQEVLMAVPYTYNILKSQKAAVDLYRKSIAVYESEKRKLDNAIGFVESASLFSMLFVNDEYDDYAISRQLKSNLSSELGKLLFELLKTKEIQQMLDEYRDLLQLQSELAKWNADLEKMNQVLGTVANAEELADLSHLGAAQFGFVDLPIKVAKKIQYKETLLTLGGRVRLQEERLKILLEMYEQKIRDAVLKELRLRSQHVVTYLSQTRYSLAELLDKAAEIK